MVCSMQWLPIAIERYNLIINRPCGPGQETYVPTMFYMHTPSEEDLHLTVKLATLSTYNANRVHSRLIDTLYLGVNKTTQYL